MDGYKILNEFLLQERVPSWTPGKINAPTFAYKCYYGKFPEPPISGREASHPQMMYRGIGIDKHIPKKALDDLNSISEIELRSSCEGDSERHLTFLIFRPLDRNKRTADRITKNLNKFKDLKACWNVGNEGLPRIIITAGLWYDKDPSMFKRWWLELPIKVKRSL